MNTKHFTKVIIAITGTTVTLFLSQNNSAQAITLTTFSPISFSDAIAGITGFQIEDFEDTTLIPGLSVEWASPNLGPVSTLPATYNPNIQGFTGNAWDGNLTLNNLQQKLWPNPISSTTTFNFFNQPTSVGIGISNLEFTGSNSSILVVNGVDFADFDNFVPAPILGTTGRSIYIRLDANTNEVINSIGIRGGSGDFLSFDRLAIKSAAQPPQSVPEPSNILGLGLLGLGLAATKMKGVLSKKAKSPTDNPQATDS